MTQALQPHQLKLARLLRTGTHHGWMLPEALDGRALMVLDQANAIEAMTMRYVAGQPEPTSKWFSPLRDASGGMPGWRDLHRMPRGDFNPYYIVRLKEWAAAEVEAVESAEARTTATLSEPHQKIQSAGPIPSTKPESPLSEDAALMLEVLRTAGSGLTAKSVAQRMNERLGARVAEARSHGVTVPGSIFTSEDVTKKLVPILKKAGIPIQNQRGKGYFVDPNAK